MHQLCSLGQARMAVGESRRTSAQARRTTLVAASGKDREEAVLLHVVDQGRPSLTHFPGSL